MNYRIIIIALTLSGCSNWISPPVNYPPTMPMDFVPPPKVNGSIYQAGYDTRLYEDKTARKVGDVLTVKLEESTAGKYESNTITDKKSQLNYPTPTFLGGLAALFETQTNTEQSFTGTGDTDQKDELKGTLTVTVAHVYPNGNLMVQGETWVTINQSQKFVQLKGIVRREDIEPDNVVSSRRVAAAQIRYSAKGQAAEASNGGFLMKFFNLYAPY